MTATTTKNEPEKSNSPSPASVFGSVASAAFGVRSSNKSSRDFTEGKFRNYVIGALTFVAIFITCVVSVVHLVLGAA